MIILDKKKILPYYKLEKTKESRDFFFSHIGYFNFWNDLLILKTKESEDLSAVLVDRGNYREKYGWGGSHRANEKQKSSFCNAITTSVYYKKPEEMFEDFPELNKWFER